MNKYDELFTAYAASPAVRDLFTTGFDDTVPAEVEPFSFVPMDGMRLIASRLGLAEGDLLLDVACGRGGPGMWVARETGASLIGVDPSKVAVEHASQRRALFGLEERATFEVGEFGALNLAEDSVDGVLCVDAAQFAPDRTAALADILRVLRPGRTLVATCWEGNERFPYFPEHLGDELAAAGFGDVQVSEHPEWLARQRKLFEAALALNPAEVEDDIGMQDLRREAEAVLPVIDEHQRVLVSGRR
jgi:SAM-dependent methyltransferase